MIHPVVSEDQDFLCGSDHTAENGFNNQPDSFTDEDFEQDISPQPCNVPSSETSEVTYLLSSYLPLLKKIYFLYESDVDSDSGLEIWLENENGD